MKSTLCVPEEIQQAVAAFVEAEEIAVQVVSAGECTVRVVQAEGRQESDLSMLYAGGWIACRTAMAAASKLDISLLKMGKLLDHLNVKIRQCSLGCF